MIKEFYYVCDYQHWSLVKLGRALVWPERIGGYHRLFKNQLSAHYDAWRRNLKGDIFIMKVPLNEFAVKRRRDDVLNSVFHHVYGISAPIKISDSMVVKGYYRK